MTVNLYDQSGKRSEDTVELDPQIFEFPENKQLLSQYVRVYLANQRQGNASTKTRGEVSGGGKKPWAQKHTGRARQGSIRSPLWVKGGVTHGPKPKDWSLVMPKNMRRQALFCALSDRARENTLLVLQELSFEKPKTKDLVNLLKNLQGEGFEKAKFLLILSKIDEKVTLAARNLQNVTAISAKDLNAYEVLKSTHLVLPKEALGVIEETFV